MKLQGLFNKAPKSANKAVKKAAGKADKAVRKVAKVARGGSSSPNLDKWYGEYQQLLRLNMRRQQAPVCNQTVQLA